MTIKITKATFALVACVVAVLLFGTVAQADTSRHSGSRGGSSFHGGHRGGSGYHGGSHGGRSGYHGGYRGGYSHHYRPRHFSHYRPHHRHYPRYYGGLVLSFPLIAAAPVNYVRPAYAPEVSFTSEPFETSAGYCREYQSTARIGTGRGNTYGTACLQPDGAWKIVD